MYTSTSICEKIIHIYIYMNISIYIYIYISVHIHVYVHIYILSHTQRLHKLHALIGVKLVDHCV